MLSGATYVLWPIMDSFTVLFLKTRAIPLFSVTLMSIMPKFFFVHKPQVDLG